MARREYSDETKAQVMAALLAGQAVSKVASDYKIPYSTVGTWAKDAKGLIRESSIQKRERIGELVVDNVEAALEATRALANVFTDETWIRRQEASQLAVLYGVLSDKTVRVLEMLPDGTDEADHG
jgi:transposase-like protein